MTKTKNLIERVVEGEDPSRVVSGLSETSFQSPMQKLLVAAYDSGITKGWKSKETEKIWQELRHKFGLTDTAIDKAMDKLSFTFQGEPSKRA